MIILLEGLVMSFWLLLICVVGTSGGAVGMVFFYENDVQKRAVELGLITEEKIKETLIKSSAKIAPSDFEANWTKKPQEY